MTEGVSKAIRDMAKRKPTNGTFELTVRCNLHCKMCMFRHDDSENPELMAKELTAEQWIDMARQIAEAGTMRLLITGGEPMLRPDFCEIWEGIYKQGFLMELYTNATLVTPKIMETLKKYPPHRIGITIYGASPETYEKVCGNGQAFERMIEGVHLLQMLPAVFEYRATLIKDNFEDGPAIDGLVQQEFGHKYGVKQAEPINKAVRGACAVVEKCRIPPEQDVKAKVERQINMIRQIIGDRFKPENLTIKRENRTIPPEKERYSLFGCEAGMSQYTITYDGKLLACQMIDAFYTEPLKSGFQTAWERFPYQVRIPQTEIKCDTCQYVNTCQSCYGSRYAETGDFNGCSEYIYQMAKERNKYEILGGEDHEKCKL